MARKLGKSPEQREAERIARRVQDLVAVNLPAEAAVLTHHEDIEVTRAGQKREGQKVTSDSARRLDAFSALRESMRKPEFVGCYDAARKFERHVIISRNEHDRGRSMERVDGEQGRDRLEAIIFASERVRLIKGMLSRRDFWLLVELIAPTRERPTWRDGVYYVTGEDNPNAQGAAVRAACVNLRDAYEALDTAPRKAA